MSDAKLRPEELTAELARLLNRNCAENASNTPDFLLAEFLRECLLALDATIKARDKWYGVSLSPGGLTPAAAPRERELESLRARVAELEGMVPRWVESGRSKPSWWAEWRMLGVEQRDDGTVLQLWLPSIQLPG